MSASMPSACEILSNLDHMTKTERLAIEYPMRKIKIAVQSPQSTSVALPLQGEREIDFRGFRLKRLGTYDLFMPRTDPIPAHNPRLSKEISPVKCARLRKTWSIMRGGTYRILSRYSSSVSEPLRPDVLDLVFVYSTNLQVVRQTENN